ncbi:PilZ domain-containing protein [Rhizorhabdus phycosphaerae]|uniref:PilZ domain-containing protein n=1 Tax=Rhizorhabdus phycosphaerae TaxID=2711156 RepID=UPI001D01FFCE|nr:PilZ domain-containing protein [Rhizorhabdus phycosphaerae]
MAGEHPAPAGKRTRKRDSLLLMASMRAAGDYARQTQPIRIRNLSPTGLMADSELDYDQGATVELDIRGVGLVEGEIVWVREGRMGITFKGVIDPKKARRQVVSGNDDNLRKLVDIGRVRRPGLRID